MERPGYERSMRPRLRAASTIPARPRLLSRQRAGMRAASPLWDRSSKFRGVDHGSGSRRRRGQTSGVAASGAGGPASAVDEPTHISPEVVGQDLVSGGREVLPGHRAGVPVRADTAMSTGGRTALRPGRICARPAQWRCSSPGVRSRPVGVAGRQGDGPTGREQEAVDELLTQRRAVMRPPGLSLALRFTTAGRPACAGRANT